MPYKRKLNNRGLVVDVEPRHVAEPLGTVATATAGGSRRVCEWAPRGLRHQSGRRWWWSLGWVELVSAGVAPISAPNRHQIYQVRTGQLSLYFLCLSLFFISSVSYTLIFYNLNEIMQKLQTKYVRNYAKKTISKKYTH